MKKTVALILAVSASNAIADEKKEIVWQKTVEKFELSVSLAGISKKYDSISSSSTIIHGFESFDACMRSGSKVAEALSEAVGTVGADTWKEEANTVWSCKPEKIVTL